MPGRISIPIARGLDYYTGTVYETFLNDYREIGSVCSGGRYENLAEYYTNKSLPGVGVSIGLTRLFYKLNELNIIKADKKSVADILIIPMLENLEEPIKLATKLRNIGINTEIYLNNKKLKAKFKYADKLEIPYVIVLGEDEISTKEITLKDMKTGNEEKLPMDEICSRVLMDKKTILLWWANGFLALYIRKVILTFLIYKTHCTQIYFINLAHEQINGKPKKKFKIS